MQSREMISRKRLIREQHRPIEHPGDYGCQLRALPELRYPIIDGKYDGHLQHTSAMQSK